MHAPGCPILRDRRLILAFFVLVLGTLFIGNASTSVWDQDEAAYAGFARNMLAGHDWVLQQFPYSQPHRKVPLTLWAIAASFAALGVNEFALRLPSLLAVVATAGCLWFGAGFLMGRRVARLAAIVLVSSALIVALGKIALTDTVLLAFETIAALALLRGITRPSWQATVLLWIAVAGGTLTKGPPILILVGGMFLVLLIFHPRRRNLIRLHPWFGLPLALAPLVVWLIIAWQRDQSLVLFLGYWYVLRRLGGSVFGQAGPPGTHFVLFFLFLAPWSAYLLSATVDGWRRLRRRRVAALLVASWLFGGWIIWEIPFSKLPTYTLGAYPVLALMLARQVHLNLAGRTTWVTHRSLRIGFHILFGVCVGLALAVLIMGVWLGSAWTKPLSVLPAGAILATGFLACRYQRRAAPLAAVKALMFGSLAAQLLIWGVTIRGLEPLRSATRSIATLVAGQCTAETTVVGAKPVSLPSLPFYVEQAGLRFRELVPPSENRQPLTIDWSLLRQWKLRQWLDQIAAQRTRKLPQEEADAQRLARTLELYRSGQPYAFVLDEAQFKALQADLVGARVMRVDGLLADFPPAVSYVVVMCPAALDPSDESPAPAGKPGN